MFFDKPETQQRLSDTGALGEPSTFAERTIAAFKSTQDRNFGVVNGGAMLDAYEARRKAVMDAVGEDIGNPFTQAMNQLPPMGDANGYGMPGPLPELKPRGQMEADFQSALERLAEKHPDKRDIIAPHKPVRSTFASEVRDREQKSIDAGRNYGGITGTGPIADFAGGMGAQVTDPVNAATILIGPTGRVGQGAKAIIGMGVKQGIANAGVEAAMAPLVQDFRRQMGQSYGLGEAAYDIGTAAALGFAADAGIRTAARGIQSKLGRRAILDADGKVTGYESAEASIARATRQAESQARAEQLKALQDDGTLQRAMDGDHEAIAKVDPILGLSEDPAFRGARQVQEFVELEPGDFDDIAKSRTFNQALRAAIDADEPPPVIKMERASNRPSLSDDMEIPKGTEGNQHFRTIDIEGKPVHFQNLDPKKITTDAEAMQFKSGGNQFGVTGALGINTTFDPAAAGKVIVFERADGMTIIVDGHQRLSIAKDGDQFQGFVFREADGWSAAEVRAEAALKNIQEGRANLLDTVRAMREHGPQMEGRIAVDTDFMRQAVGMSRLSDAAFVRLEAGTIEPHMAALVGELVPDATKHDGVMQALLRANPPDEASARKVIGREIREPVTVEGQTALLGAHDVPDDLIAPRSEVLGDVGAVMRQGTPEQMAASLVIERLSDRPGYVSNLLTDAARAIHTGQPKTRVVDAFMRQIEVTAKDGGVEARIAEPPRVERFADPDTGVEMSAGDVDAVIDMTRYVQDMRKVPQPKTLYQWIMSTGRLKDDGGELTTILGGKNRQLISGKGRSLDEAASSAWQAGYMQGERPTVDEFLQLIDRSVRGEKIVSVHDADILEEISVARDMENELEQFGIKPTASADDIRQHFARKGDEGQRRGASPLGGEEDPIRLASFTAAGREELESAKAQGFDTSRVLYHGTGSAIDAFDLSKAVDKEGRQRGLGLGKGKIYLTGNRYSAGEWALQAPDRGLGDAPNVVPVFVRGNLVDEKVYTAKFSELSGGRPIYDSTLTMQERDALIAKTDDWAKSEGYAGIRQAYRDQAGQIMEVGQVAIFDPTSIRSINATFDPAQADSPVLLAALSDVDTGRSMRRDLDALGYYSKALEAAKAIPQAKGTPEQMLAALKKAGVKDAEIEATNIAAFLEGKKSVTRDDLVKHLTDNRVGVIKVVYGGVDASPDTLDHIDATIREIRDTADIRGGQFGTELRRAADQIERQRQRDPMEFDNEAFWEGLTNNEDVAAAISAAQDNALEARSRPVKIETLETPSGPRGWKENGERNSDKSQTGFTLFPITDKVRKSVTEEGQPLFSKPAQQQAPDMAALKSFTENLEAVLKDAQKPSPPRLVDDVTGKDGKAHLEDLREEMADDIKGAVDPVTVEARLAAIRAYHGTGASFDKFKPNGIGPHFGAVGQAESRLNAKNQRYASEGGADPSGYLDGSNIIPVDLNLSRVVDLPDMNAWGAQQVADAISNAAPDLAGLSADVARILRDGLKRKAHQFVERDANDHIRKTLINNGYDGIKYSNKFEGNGDSYIAVAPGTVRSATTGDILFSNHNQISSAASIDLSKPLIYTPEANARMSEIRKEIDRTLQMLPPDVRIRAEDELVFNLNGGSDARIAGLWDGYDRLVYVALSGNDPVRAVRHEVIHALKQSGLLTADEFKQLYAFSETLKLRGAYKIDERYRDLYTKAYGERGGDYVENLLREETIAEMFADYSLNGRRFGDVAGGGLVDRLIDRIVSFMKLLRDNLGFLGFRNVNDIFQAIESGEVASRPSSRNPSGARNPDVVARQIGDAMGGERLAAMDGQRPSDMINAALAALPDETATAIRNVLKQANIDEAQIGSMVDSLMPMIRSGDQAAVAERVQAMAKEAAPQMMPPQSEFGRALADVQADKEMLDVIGACRA